MSNDNQQQLIADRLRNYQAQGQYQAPQGRMAGNVYVAPHFLEYLASGLRSAGGQAGHAMAEGDLKNLDTQRQQSTQQDMQKFVQALRGTPEQTMAPATPNDDNGNPMPNAVTPATPGDPYAAYSGLTSSAVPELRKMGVAGTLQMPELEARRGEKETERAWRAQQAQMADQRARELAQQASDDRRYMADQSSADRRFIAGQARDRDSTNKPPPGYRWTPDGNQERIPGGPADAKAQAAEDKMAAGAGDVDIALGTLRDAYDRLEQGGGITSTANNPLKNVAAATASSGLGQAAGKYFGTDNQSARNDIAMARPALLAALMKATGMSAKQMDSNAELKLWLSTATDPTLDVESNRRALENIERKYMKPGAAAPKPASSPEDQAAMEWANANPNDPRAAAIKAKLNQ